MNAIDIADAMLRHLERCRLAPYQDSAGLWTIGIGSRYLLDGSPVTAHTPPVSQAEADALLNHALLGTVMRVDAAVRVPLDPAQHAALFSLAYNIGCHAFEGSTLLRVLNTGDVLRAAGHFAEWNRSGGRVVQGLVNRRAYERGVFLGLAQPAPPIPIPPAPPAASADDLNAAELARVIAT